jgi:hypothetical protein
MLLTLPMSFTWMLSRLVEMIPAVPSAINGFFQTRKSTVGSGGAIRELGTADGTRVLLMFGCNANITYSIRQQDFPTNVFTFNAGDPPVVLTYADYGAGITVPWYAVSIGQIEVLEVFYRPHVQPRVQ